MNNSKEEKRRFNEYGNDDLAIDPKSLHDLYAISKQYDYENGHYVTGDQKQYAVIPIDGPLMQKSFWWSSYESIQNSFERALSNDSIKGVILDVSSPGGVMSGLLSTAKSMRKSANKAKKPVIAFVNESAFSAAYALACVADKIIAPNSGAVGSIGVIATMVDYSEQEKQQGIKVVVVSSGKLKTDSHPSVPISKEAIQRQQEKIDYLAGLFFDWVSERRGIEASKVKALDAGIFYGQDAIDQSLIDQIGDIEQAFKAIDKRIKNQMSAENFKLITQELGLSENTDVATVLGKLASLKAGSQLANELKTQNEKLSQDKSKLSEELKTQSEKLAIDKLVSSALQSGKLTEAMLEKPSTQKMLQTLESATNFINAIEAFTPINKQFEETSKKSEASNNSSKESVDLANVKIDDDERAILNGMIGIDEAAFLAFKRSRIAAKDKNFI